jgi:hypothetical protein
MSKHGETSRSNSICFMPNAGGANGTQARANKATALIVKVTAPDPFWSGNRHAPLRTVGFGGQTPDNYCCREHDEPRNQMISGPGRPIEYMLYQKRQAAKRY